VEIPLFVLGGAFYPQGVSYLNVFEMKYRTMMFDIGKGDDTFGYIHSENGQIAAMGTLCKVTNRELLEDGRQLIAFEGVSRFRVRRIIKTLPYIVAEVEPNIEDKIPSDMKEAIKLEQDAYDALKYYMRLMKTHSNTKVL
jgi:Lon protease-like protein